MNYKESLSLPTEYFDAFYDGSHYPGSKKYKGLKKGTNCQGFVYEILKHFGYHIPNFRSSELWIDTVYTKQVKSMKPLDILFFNKTEDSYGAHLALYLGANKLMHLSKEVGYVTIWDLKEFEKRKRYQVLIGIKRPYVKVESLL